MTKRAPIRYFRSASSLLPAMLLALSLAATAQAQWTTQTIQLQAGWNAVYLEVQPEPRECDAVLAGLPVESVWRWNKRFSTVEYIDDPNTLLPSQPDWLVHLPAQHPLAGQTTLYTMDGGRSYLIKLVDGSGPVTWNVKGKVVVRPVDWIGDSLNFVGFTLPTGGTPPTYQAFFTGSPAHANQPIYRLNTAGFWQLTTASNPMKRGESFWIRCQGRSTFQGPITVGLAKRTGLDYGQDLVEETINVRNSSSLSQTVQIKRLDSATPPPEAAELLAGQVPLRYWKPAEPSGDDAGWKPLPSILSKTLAPGQEWEVKLEVRRAEMSGSTTANAKHQSLVEVTDSANLSRSLIPVTAETVQSSGAGGVHSRAGLWVGHAEITHVNQPSSTSPETPLPVANPFTFRLLIHVSGSGDARLLQRVLQMWKSGTYSIRDDGVREVNEPGRFVLLTRTDLIPHYSGAALRDGEPVARRYSTAAFAFHDPVPLTRESGSFGAPGGNLIGSVVLSFDDPLNPFVHRYHPDHNNLDDRFQPFPSDIAEGRESYTVTRSLSFTFADEDPDRLALAGWGDNQLGGAYDETITGMHRSALRLRGTFRLQRASTVAALNDGLSN